MIREDAKVKEKLLSDIGQLVTTSKLLPWHYLHTEEK
jgi:hypothetical protein